MVGAAGPPRSAAPSLATRGALNARGAGALPAARGEEAPPRPAVGPLKLRVRVPEAALHVMGRLPRQRLGSHAGAACRAEEQAEKSRGQAHARSVPGRARADQTRGPTRASRSSRRRSGRSRCEAAPERPHARRSRVRGVRGHVSAPQTKVRPSDNLTRYVARRPRAPEAGAAFFSVLPLAPGIWSRPSSRRRLRSVFRLIPSRRAALS